MHPWLIQAAGWKLPSYPVILALAALVSLLYFRWLCRQPGRIAPPDSWLLINLVVLAGIVGGRLFGFLADYAQAGIIPRPASIWVNDEGVPTYGVLIGVCAGSWAYAALRKQSVGRTLDLVFLVVPLCHAIARIGCFLAGCCYGSVAPARLPWSVTYLSPDSELPASLRGIPLHPTPLYESLGDALIALLLYVVVDRLIRSRTLPVGSVCAAFFLGYGTLRLICDCFRGDFVAVAGTPFSLAQLMSLASVATVAVLAPRLARDHFPSP